MTVTNEMIKQAMGAGWNAGYPVGSVGYMRAALEFALSPDRFAKVPEDVGDEFAVEISKEVHDWVSKLISDAIKADRLDNR